MKNDFCAAWPVTTKRIGFIFRTSLIKTSWTDYIRGRPPCGEPLTETPRHGEKFLLGTPTSSSASANLSDDSAARPLNPVRQNTVSILALAGFNRIAPDQDTGMDIKEPWISALGLFNAGG